MTTAVLCKGKDPELWDTHTDGARLALMICGVCDGCPKNDPTPHGVIRQGVPYSDEGVPLPICHCGYPVTDYAGGDIRCCLRCREIGEQVRPAEHRERVTALWAEGLGYIRIAQRIGASAAAVKHALERWGLNEAARPTPATANLPRAKCPQDHAYDDVNTYIAPSGGRRCRQCARDRNTARRRQKTKQSERSR